VARELSVIIGWPIRGRGRDQGPPVDQWQAGEGKPAYYPTIVNRQIGIEHSKNVIVFDPLLTGHVIRRMRSGRVLIFNGNQWETL